MEYSGKDLNKKKCKKYIKKSCIVKKNSFNADVVINIEIIGKKKHNKIAKIEGFLYNYETLYYVEGEMNALHIKSLYTSDEYLRKGIATYLMKEAIKYAESKKVKHITTHPFADTCIISQEELEKFYKKFSFSYGRFPRKKREKIEFCIIAD